MAAPWQPDSPILLARGNGVLVCKAHRQVICGRCGVDYSFILDESDDGVETIGFPRALEEEDEVSDGEVDEEAPNIMRQIPTRRESLTRAELQYRFDGTLVVPSIQSFVPPTPATTPQQLFPLQPGPPNRQFPRFTHRSDPGTILIYTDGACLNNGQPNPAAGWGFVFREPEPDLPELGRVSGRLEDFGPSGEPHPQTSNRAELRAVIAALQYRVWFGDGSRRLVIATDSEYVTRGATEWVRTWGRNGWVTSNRTAVKNRDLWEELLCRLIGHRERGMEICFWRIPRAWNTEADRIARVGARKERLRSFISIIGLLE
jgi:ribonuclease HI